MIGFFGRPSVSGLTDGGSVVKSNSLAQEGIPFNRCLPLNSLLSCEKVLLPFLEVFSSFFGNSFSLSLDDPLRRCLT